MERLSLLCVAAEAFLYLPILFPPQRKDDVKETCHRNISRKE